MVESAMLEGRVWCLIYNTQQSSREEDYGGWFVLGVIENFGKKILWIVNLMF